MDREAFLIRVRNATRVTAPKAAPYGTSHTVAPHGASHTAAPHMALPIRSAPEPSAPVSIDSPGAYPAPASTPLQTLAARWRRAHAAWHHVRPGEAAGLIATILTDRGIDKIAVSDHPLLQSINIPEEITRAGLSRVALDGDPEGRRTSLAAAGAGITAAEYAVAETATLIEIAGPAQPRTLSLVPPFHIAVVRAESILPDLDHLFRALAGAPQRHAMILISGPSGTADIGLTHVVGVHGPREVHLIVVDPSLGD